MEFKIDEELEGEISTLQTAGDTLNGVSGEISGESVSTLKTSLRLVAEHQAIAELIFLYCQLVSKEVSDLYKMMESARRLDETAAGTL